MNEQEWKRYRLLEQDYRLAPERYRAELLGEWPEENVMNIKEQDDAGEPIMRFFDYGHLPQKLQEVSVGFYLLAHELIRTLPRCAERTVALRKLLEGKDAAVRAALPPEPGR